MFVKPYLPKHQLRALKRATLLGTCIIQNAHCKNQHRWERTSAKKAVGPTKIRTVVNHWWISYTKKMMARGYVSHSERVLYPVPGESCSSCWGGATLRSEVETRKDENISYQKQIIGLQNLLIEKQGQHLKAVKSTVETEMKTYSEAVTSTVQSEMKTIPPTFLRPVQRVWHQK